MLELQELLKEFHDKGIDININNVIIHMNWHELVIELVGASFLMHYEPVVVY